MAKVLKRLSITMEPHRFLDRATAFRITVDADNKERFETIEVVEESQFKSIAELVFERTVRKFRNEMGWK